MSSDEKESNVSDKEEHNDDDDDEEKSEEKEDEGGDSSEDKKERGPPKKKKWKQREHPPTIEMIVEALEHYADYKGTSVKLIKSYILDTFPSVREDMVKGMMKRAITLGMKDGVLVRPKKQENTPMLAGSYILAHPKKEEEFKPRPASLRQFNKPHVKKKKGKGKKKRRHY